MTMTQTEFLDLIYGYVQPGMRIQKPRKISTVLEVTDAGDIYYRIGTTNKKAITRNDLIKLYWALNQGELTEKVKRAIAGSSRPCNKTTLDWLIKALALDKRFQ